MAQLPEIARLTLKSMPAGETHPEPGQVAAFAEQALPQHQRAYVLNHLAACLDCRDLLQIIVVPEPVPAVPQVSVPSRSWSLWESLRRAPVRWAGMAATAAVVATAVWVGQMEDTPTPLPTQAQIFRAEPQAAWSGGGSASEAAPQSRAAGAPKSKQPFQVDPQAITAPAGAASASASPAQEHSDAAGQALSMAAAARNLRSQQSGEEPVADNKAPANSALSDNSLWATGIVTPAPQSNTTAPAAQAQWMISSGVLRRSLDNGVTWQDYAMQVGASLRAVAAVGNHVWVGGSNGILYHSSDSGQQWQRVIPISPQGRSFSGDVVSLTFPDPQNGTIMTNSGDRWITSDGGQSWRFR